MRLGVQASQRRLLDKMLWNCLLPWVPEVLAWRAVSFGICLRIQNMFSFQSRICFGSLPWDPKRVWGICFKIHEMLCVFDLESTPCFPVFAL